MQPSYQIVAILFWCMVLRKSSLDFDQHEELVTELHPVRNLREKIKQGAISHQLV